MLLDAGESIELCSKGHGKMGMVVTFCDFARRFNFNKLQLGGMAMSFAYTSRTPPLCTACFAGNLAALKLLLDRGADIHNRGHIRIGSQHFTLQPSPAMPMSWWRCLRQAHALTSKTKQAAHRLT